KREQLVDYIESHKALLSPGHRLPPDFLQEIFIACSPTHRNTIMSAREAPLILGHICNGWRSLAHSTSPL
ncbi:hypothetical protein C8R44DRAFT_648114, partial [Mycena epipterygia]